jgi:hypothetical protein
LRPSGRFEITYDMSSGDHETLPAASRFDPINIGFNQRSGARDWAMPHGRWPDANMCSWGGR